jgi:hypothetical protein
LSAIDAELARQSRRLRREQEAMLDAISRGNVVVEWAIRSLPAPRRRPGVSPAVPSRGRYDDIVSAQPVERDDPLDPQRILDDLPADEHGFFLDQYREAVDNARDPADWKQLRRVLRLWRFHADTAGDPGYREALDAARGPVSGGMALEDAVRVYRPAS